MAIIEKLPARGAEGIQAFTSRIRPWAEADDGKPVFVFLEANGASKENHDQNATGDKYYLPMEN